MSNQGQGVNEMAKASKQVKAQVEANVAQQVAQNVLTDDGLKEHVTLAEQGVELPIEPIAEVAPIVITMAAAETKPTKYIYKVTGPNCGRSRYITRKHTLDAWKFHALQFDTKEEATAKLDLYKAALPLNKVEVLAFENAWFEQLATN
jgi:hypothetical protein